MGNPFNDIGNIGIQQTTDIRIRGNIKLINTFGFFAGIASLIYSAIYYFTGSSNLWLYCFLFGMAYFIPIALNQFRQLSISRFYFIILIVFTCIILSCIIGSETYLQFGLIIPIALSFILYSDKEYKYRILFISISTISFIILEFSNYSLFKRISVNENILFYSHLSIGLTLLSLFILMLHNYTKHINLAEEEQKKWVHIFENAEWGIAVTHANGSTMNMINPAFAKMHGYTVDELTGKSVIEVYAPKIRENIHLDIEKADTKGHHLFESEHIRKDGSHFPVLLDVSVVRNMNNEIRYRTVNILDITQQKKTEKKINDSNQRYRDLFENSPIAIWEEDISELIAYFNELRNNGISNLQHYFTKQPESIQTCSDKIRVIDINKATLKLFKASDKSELINNITTLFTEKSYSSFVKLLIAVFQGRKDFKFDTEYKTLKNETISVSVKIHIIKQANNISDYSRIQLAMEDISIRKKVEKELNESEERFRTIFEQAAIGVVQADWDTGQFVKVNQKYLDIVGFPKEELLKLTFKDITHPDDIQEDIDNLKLLKLGKIPSFSMSKRYIRKDGTYIWVKITVSPLTNHNSSTNFLIAIVEDISESKRAREALLKSEIELKEANITKDKFFSIIAHDLKSPFNIILGYADLLKKGYDTLDDSTRKKFIEEIDTSAQTTFTLLENLLTWTRSKQNRIVINKEKLRLAELVDMSTTPYSPNARKKHIVVINEVPEDVVINADKYTLSTAIGNIVNNAIKFTHEGGKVTITSHDTTQEIELQINDTGIGMNHEQLDQLFRIENSFSTPGTNHEKGTGLGLILCKEFVEKNEGTISVKSTVGKGSTFVLCFKK